MELYQIRYFLAVADTLNFTRASQRAFVSQPALTKAIQRLEEAIGGRLFDRNTTAVQLTELGRNMLPSFRQLHEGANQAREQARRLARGQPQRVRVGVMCTIDLRRVLDGFVEQDAGLEGIEVVFREGNLESLTEALDQGDIDMGILCSPYETPRRFAATPLYREDYVVAIGDDHRFGGRGAVDAGELHRERYCERLQCEFSSYIDRQMADRGIALDVVQQSLREDWIQSFVRASFGVAFMPATLAEAARLDHVRLADSPIVREVQLLVQADRTLTEAQQQVMRCLSAYHWGPMDRV